MKSSRRQVDGTLGTVSASPAGMARPRLVAKSHLGRVWLRACGVVIGCLSSLVTTSPTLSAATAGNPVYSGVTTTTLTITGAASSMNGFRYRCVATNGSGTAISNAAELTVSAPAPVSVAGTYFGTLANGGGYFALSVGANNAASYIAYLEGRSSAVVGQFTVAADGSFSVPSTEIVAAGTGASSTVRGQIAAGSVSGQIDPFGQTFAGTVDGTAGSAPAGYFAASQTNGTGATYMIVASSGQALIVASTGSVVEASRTTVSGSGELASTTVSGGLVTASIDGARNLLVSLVPGGSSNTVKYGIAKEQTPSGGGETAMANISTRAYCAVGNSVTIGGFVVSGNSPKRVLIRAVGPTLSSSGLGSTVLLDPTVEIYHGSTVIGSNDNWTDNRAAVTSFSAQVGAAPLAADDTTSSGLVISLPAGVYSFVVRGKNGTSGIVLLETYDAERSNTSATLVNMAARAYAGTGNGVTITGFVIGGTTPRRVLLRAMGPTLVTQGLAASEVLMDPIIEVHHGAETIAVNDSWRDNANYADIVTTGARIGATPFAANDTQSAALLMTLAPGVYSCIAQGKNATSGIVLVEVYDSN